MTINLELLKRYYALKVAECLTDLRFLEKTSNLHYTRGITPKRVTSDWAHFRGTSPDH